MIKFIKQYKPSDDFRTLIRDIIDVGYADDITDSELYLADIDTYSQYVAAVVMYTQQHLPGFFNKQYPNCISTTVGPYMCNYIKDGIGLGVKCKVDRKNGEVSYELTIYYNKPKNLLKYDETFSKISARGDFKLEEVGFVNKKSKK